MKEPMTVADLPGHTWTLTKTVGTQQPDAWQDFGRAGSQA